MPEMDASLWFAVIGPARLPKSIVARLNQEINAILKEPDVQDVLDKQAIAVEISTPEALRAQIAADIEKWREVARVAGVKPE